MTWAGVLACFFPAAVSARMPVRDTAGDARGRLFHAAGAASLDTFLTYQIHNSPDFRVTITNWGYFGTVYGSLVDSSDTSTGSKAPAPSFESPPHSHVEYLYDAGLWIGGIVGGDTLVSTGNFSFDDQHELYPDSSRVPAYTDWYGDEEFSVTYSDTFTDPAIVTRDLYDGLHRPLPVRVHQTTRLLEQSPYGEGLLIEVTVINRGVRPIDQLWLGWMIDPDIGSIDRPDAPDDDLTGYHTATIDIGGHAVNVHAAWAADNDGDPDSVTGQFGARSCPRVFASMYLGGHPRLAAESYNWWMAAYDPSYDWGPQRQPGELNRRNGRGRPLGDAMRYRFMSNREIDYDQVYAAIDFSDSGWIPPTRHDIAVGYAKGYDTRFLQTVGPIDLQPGDSVTTKWVWAAIPDWHTDPQHFKKTFDALAPQAYLAGLNVTALDTTLARFQDLVDFGFDGITIAPPRAFRVRGWDSCSVLLSWLPRHTKRLEKYVLQRSLDSSAQEWPYSWTLPAAESTFTDSDLDRATRYYFALRSVATGAGPGRASVTSVLPDRPYAPVPTAARRGNRAITVEWEPAAEPQIVRHRIYRRDTARVTVLAGETDQARSFTDRGVQNATLYTYTISAVSARGNESAPSSPLAGLAFAFDGPPLVIDHTPSGMTSLTDKDSVSAIWKRILRPVRAAYVDADPIRVIPYPFGLGLYDRHPAVVVASEGHYPVAEPLRSQLELYAYAGGALVLSGRELFNKDQIAEGWVKFENHPSSNDGVLALPQEIGVTAAYYPGVLLSHPTRLNAEFVGAASNDPHLPDLDVDSSRTAWGINPLLPAPPGAVPFVGYFEVDTMRAEVLYRFKSANGMSSPMDGKAAAVMSKNPDRHIAALSFPLSYMKEAQARDALAAILSLLGWSSRVPGDADNDGIVTAADVSFLIGCVYRGRPLRSTVDADVNGDCRVDLLDIVILIDYVARGGSPPLPGCEGGTVTRPGL